MVRVQGNASVENGGQLRVAVKSMESQLWLLVASDLGPMILPLYASVSSSVK